MKTYIEVNQLNNAVQLASEFIKSHQLYHKIIATGEYLKPIQRRFPAKNGEDVA